MALDKKTKTQAYSLMDKHGKDTIYVKQDDGHMYFSKTCALESVEGDEKALITLTVNKEAEPERKPNPNPLTALRAKYKKLAGKEASNQWDEPTLKEKIASLEDKTENNEQD